MPTTTKTDEIDKRQRVLVIDNDSDMLKLLNRVLDLEGFNAVTVADEDEAVKLLDTQAPGMVIMDTIMPDENVLRTIDRLREHSNIPIVVLASYGEVTTLKEAFDHGADDFIRKPFGTKVFAARLKAKLRRYQHEARQ